MNPVEAGYVIIGVSHLDVTNADGHVHLTSDAFIMNQVGGKTVYLNVAAAATTDGFELAAGEILPFPIAALTELHAICGGTDVSILKIMYVR